MTQVSDRIPMTSQRVRSYWLLAAGTLASGFLLWYLARDHGGIGAGSFFKVSLVAMLIGFLGIVSGCVVEQRWKELLGWGIGALLAFVYLLSQLFSPTSFFTQS